MLSTTSRLGGRSPLPALPRLSSSSSFSFSPRSSLSLRSSTSRSPRSGDGMSPARLSFAGARSLSPSPSSSSRSSVVGSRLGLGSCTAGFATVTATAPANATAFDAEAEADPAPAAAPAAWSRSSSSSASGVGVGVGVVGKREPLTPERFAALSPVERIQAIYMEHGSHAVQLASMQKTSCVIMHLIHRAQVDIPIWMIDTQLLHQETQQLANDMRAAYGVQIVQITPDLTPEEQDEIYGPKLWMTSPGQKQCCFLRKEKPLLNAIQTYEIQATMSGLMRAEGGARATVEPVSADARAGTIVYNPLFDWCNKDVHAYIEEHNVPVNALYSQGFRSIGCHPCTTKSLPGEDARAGRWRHLRKEGETAHAYCGINFSDMAKAKGKRKEKRKGGLYGRKKRAVEEEEAQSESQSESQSYGSGSGESESESQAPTVPTTKPKKRGYLGLKKKTSTSRAGLAS